MLTLTDLNVDLKPYGFVRLDYGRTWTCGGIAFIGGKMTVLNAQEQDIEAIARLYKDGLIAERRKDEHFNTNAKRN